MAVGLGVADTVQHFLPSANVQVKWPNDVWLEGRKCSGILSEANSVGSLLKGLVIGIGLNVNRQVFDANASADEATSLIQHTEEPLDRNLVLATLLLQVEQWVDRLTLEGSGAIAAALAPRLAMRGHLVQCEGVRGELLGVADNGALRIRTRVGEQLVVSGRLKEETHG